MNKQDNAPIGDTVFEQIASHLYKYVTAQIVEPFEVYYVPEEDTIDLIFNSYDELESFLAVTFGYLMDKNDCKYNEIVDNAQGIEDMDYCWKYGSIVTLRETNEEGEEKVVSGLKVSLSPVVSIPLIDILHMFPHLIMVAA